MQSLQHHTLARPLRTASLALAVFLAMSAGMVSTSHSQATRAESQAGTELPAAAGEPLSPGEISDYASREAASPQLSEFSGGDGTIIIGTTAAIIIVAVILLIVLL